MLRIIQTTRAAGAKGYYSTADYYTERQELEGVWRGLGAERLDLSGPIAKREWDVLCDNRHPATGRTLTLRQKEPRRVGYDFNWHVPKSVSLLYGLTGDERLLAAFRDSVGETMREMEAEMQTRVRTRDRNEDRVTGNMVWGEFVHTTARPVDGVPDPHLHAHCFVFNTTFDPEEGRWKAGQFSGLKRDAPYFEAVFHSRLARRMEELGLEVTRSRTGWELAGITKSALDKFSRRTALIEAVAREKGITDPDRKGALGASTRERKAGRLTQAELRREWRSRLSSEDWGGVRDVGGRIGTEPIREDPTAAARGVERAEEHCFERSSVMPERTLLREALRRSVGSAAVDSVRRAYQARPLVRAERDGRRLVTTPEVLAEERRMLAFAREGRGICPPLGGRSWREHRFGDERLNAGQRRAVLHVLGSPDRVILVRGAAGVGKTTMMQEAVAAIGQSRRVLTLAPSAEASRA